MSTPTTIQDLRDLENRFLLTSKLVDRQTTLVTPIVDGEEYFRRIGTYISRCKGEGDVIYIVGWTFQNDLILPELTTPISTLLHQKGSIKVDVRMLLWASRWLTGTDMADSIPERLFNFGAETVAKPYTEMVAGNIALAHELRELGPPDFPLKGRVLLDWSGTRSHHAKYTLVKAGNELHAVIGIDYNERRVDVPGHPGTKQWHDVGIDLEGGAVMRVWEDFLTRWKECTTLPVAHFRTSAGPKVYNTPTPFPDTPIPVPEHPPDVSYSVQILRSQGPTKRFKYFMDPWLSVPWQHYPPGGVQEVWDCFKKAIAAAKHYIYVEDQALNDRLNKHDTVFPHVAQALNNNDVKVIFVTRGPATLSPDIEQMLDTVENSKHKNFVVYRVDKLMVHSKVVLIDDRFLAAGSANFFDSSMRGADSELTVAAVDTGSLVTDIRVKLWKDHVRISPDSPDLPGLEVQMRDWEQWLTFWRKTWGTGVPIDRGPVLKLVGPPDPE